MKANIWERISSLGLNPDDDSLTNRANRLANRINIVLIAILTLLNAFLIVQVITQGLEYNLYASRLLIMEGILFLNLYLARIGRFKLVKATLIFVPVAVLVVVPALLGYVQTSSFFYYHIIVIGLSLAPVALLIPSLEKRFYGISIGYFLLIMILLDDWMINLSDSDATLKELISHFRIYYKIIPLSIFCFIQLALLYLRKMSTDFEQALIESNHELKKRIQEAEMMQAHLVQSEKMVSLGTMVAGIGHELNSPLTYIKGAVTIVNKEIEEEQVKLEPTTKEAIRIIEMGVDRASQIVGSMKSFSYKESIVKEQVSITQLIDECLSLIGVKNQSDIVISKKYEFHGSIPIYEEKVRQLTISLLDNALYAVNDASPDKKLVVISTQRIKRKHMPFARIAIFNTGLPIPDKIISRIFDPFFTTKPPGQGTGLGLSISHSHVSAHNGILEVTNVDGGVEFSVILPLN